MPELAPARPLPVLIIGSGLGGLTLAHMLRKHGIPYQIFERDSSLAQRAQGYRISIDGGGGGGADALKAALSTELFDTFERSCAEQNPPVGRVDGQSGTLLQAGVLGLIGAGGWGLFWALGSRYLSKTWGSLTWGSLRAWLGSRVSGVSSGNPRPIVPASVDCRYQVDRRVLRSILLTSQSSEITYDSAFTSYALSADSVTAYFANGTSATGSLIVGADGIRSKVAAQLIGHTSAPRDLGVRIIYGKTHLTPEVEEELHPTIKKGVAFVVDTTPDGQRITVVLESMRFTHPSAPKNYLFWALSARTEVFGDNDAELLASQGAAIAEMTTRITANWDPRIKLVFDKQTIDQTAVLRMTTSDPDGPLEWQTERRVTVLGDAVHCMPPTGGKGANSAMYDAALLGAALRDSGEDGVKGWSAETIRRYEEAMRYNIGDIVGMACIAACKIMGATPIDSQGLHVAGELH